MEIITSRKPLDGKTEASLTINDSIDDRGWSAHLTLWIDETDSLRAAEQMKLNAAHAFLLRCIAALDEQRHQANKT